MSNNNEIPLPENVPPHLQELFNEVNQRRKREKELQSRMDSKHEEVLAALTDASSYDRRDTLAYLAARIMSFVGYGEQSSTDPDDKYDMYHTIIEASIEKIVQPILENMVTELTELHNYLVKNEHDIDNKFGELANDTYIYYIKENVADKHSVMVLETQSQDFLVVLDDNKYVKRQAHIRKVWPRFNAEDHDYDLENLEKNIKDKTGTDLYNAVLKSITGSNKYSDWTYSYSKFPSIECFAENKFKFYSEQSRPCARYGDTRDRGYVVSINNIDTQPGYIYNWRDLCYVISRLSLAFHFMKNPEELE